jgi:DNA-binding NarL/FixJ family response regulator
MTKSDFKILIIEDEVLVAMDIKEMLTKFGFSVIGLADKMLTAVALFQQYVPHLILCDIKIKGNTNGIDVINEIRKNQLPFEVIYLTAYSDERTLLDAFKTNPKSYLLKPFTEIQLEIAVTQVFHQKVETLVQFENCPFTSRELDILYFLEQGLSSKDIALKLDISIGTVKTHRKNMMNKIGTENSLKLIKTAIGNGWIKSKLH